MASLPLTSFASTLPVQSGAAHALIVGDWGWLEDEASLRNGAPHAAQSQVARGMLHYAAGQRLTPDALFFLGDNWYGDLPDGARSSRWDRQFESMYPASAFPGPAYAMLGNHDYQMLPATVNKVEAELEYAKSGLGADGKATRWTMPSRWYAFDFPRQKPLVHCIVLDSNMPFADGRPQQGANFTLTPAERQQQLRWLQAELERPRTTPFRIVMAHHPIYSNGPHGDHPMLVQDWAPLLAQHRVDFYLAGHDHDLQVLQMEGQPTVHFLSGGGGADLYVLKRDDMDRGPYAQEVHGFSHMAVTRDRVQMRHLDTGGRLLFGVEKDTSGRVRTL